MSWPTVAITECARIVGGATPKSSISEYWDGDIPWVTPKDLSGLNSQFIDDTPRKITRLGLSKCSAEVLPAGSVLFSSRAPIGHVAINRVPMATNQGFKSMIPGPELDAGFLYWWLVSHKEQLQAMGTGATFKEVSKAVVERIAIPLPPLEEQRRIAAILDQADSLRRLRHRTLNHLNTLAQSIFHEMFGDRENIERVGLSQIIEVRSSLADPKLPENRQMLHVGPEHIESNSGFIAWERVQTCEEDGVTSGKYVFSSGDIIYSKIRPYLNKVAIADRPGMCSADMYALHCNDTCILPSYLHFMLGSSDFLSYAAQSSGRANIPKINRTQLLGYDAPLPSLRAQREFQRKADEIYQYRTTTERHLSGLESGFTSLQHRAFRGEL